MFRKLFYLVLFCAIGAGIWGAFALWTGIYSVYSIPPSHEQPDGVTLIITRDEGEPMFNSPAYVPPQKKPTTPQSGLGFGTIHKPKRPVESRTIMRLPYVDWAYKKSLEPQEDSL